MEGTTVKVRQRWGLLCALIWLSGCSHVPSKWKTILLSSAAASIGATVGAVTTPRGENPVMHGALWGSAAGLAGATAGTFLFSEDKKLRRKEAQLDALRSRIDDRDRETRALVHSGSIDFEKAVPIELRSRFRKGSWKLYALDEWRKESGTGNRLIHQDKMFIYEPPVVEIDRVLTRETKEIIK